MIGCFQKHFQVEIIACHIWYFSIFLFRKNIAGNVNSILDILEDDNQDLPLSDDDEDNTGVTYCNVTVFPPTEEPGADTDEDSDQSDNEVGGDFHHLPSRVLGAESELSIGKRVISVSQEEDGSQQVEVNIIFSL